MGSMRVFLKSFGCPTNLSDGAAMAGCLMEAGYRIVNSVSLADIVVYNTCAVKGPTENRMIHALRQIPKDRKLVVAGCLPLINLKRLNEEVEFDGAVGPAAGEKIVEYMDSILNGRKVIALGESLSSMPKLSLPSLKLNPVVSIIPINYGCLGSCAYCCVTFARGELRSYGIEEIVERFRRDLADGMREFWLCSQDTGCYGMDRGTNLAKLLGVLCQIDGDFRIRVGMMTPNLALTMIKDLVRAFADERIYKFIHLPVQSGDDQVLKNMQRLYAVDDFKNVLGEFRFNYPKMTVATDIICGFPGEDKEAFSRSLQLIEEIKPDIVNVSKFFARPGTPAAKMEENLVPLSEIRLRSSEMVALSRKVSFERNRQWIDWNGKILVNEVGKVSGSWVGRNFAYKPIAVKGADRLLGRALEVKIAEAFPTYLEGEIIE